MLCTTAINTSNTIRQIRQIVEGEASSNEEWKVKWHPLRPGDTRAMIRIIWSAMLGMYSVQFRVKQWQPVMMSVHLQCVLSCSYIENHAVGRQILSVGTVCSISNRLWFAVAQNMYCEGSQSVTTFGLGWRLLDRIALACCAFVVLVFLQCTCRPNWSYWNCLC